MVSEEGPVAASGRALEPEDTTWVNIGPAGQESEGWGTIWGDGPSIAGMKTWWVLPDPPEATQGRAEAVVLVARASRRHQVGRDVDGRWNPRGGRFVDIGEYFRETDPRSRFNRPFTPPTHAVMRAPDAVGRVELEAFAALCEAAERRDSVERTGFVAERAARQGEALSVAVLGRWR
jgi:hypothetical protein